MWSIETEYTKLGISFRIFAQIVPLPAPDGPDITINNPLSDICTPMILLYLRLHHIAQVDVLRFLVELQIIQFDHYP